jgi:NADPH2:quinone reductase
LKSDNDQGAFTIKLAQQSNIHPIIAVAGKGEAFVEKLISREKGDTIIDYRKGDEAVVSGIKDAVKAAGANEVKYAFDAVSEKGSYVNISKVLAKEGGRMTNVLPGRDYYGGRLSCTSSQSQSRRRNSDRRQRIRIRLLPTL